MSYAITSCQVEALCVFQLVVHKVAKHTGNFTIATRIFFPCDSVQGLCIAISNRGLISTEWVSWDGWQLTFFDYVFRRSIVINETLRWMVSCFIHNCLSLALIPLRSYTFGRLFSLPRLNFFLRLYFRVSWSSEFENLYLSSQPYYGAEYAMPLNFQERIIFIWLYWRTSLCN